MKLGFTLSELKISDDLVNCWRGKNYSPIDNHHFLLDLADVDLCAPYPDEVFFRYPFDSVRLRYRNDRNIFSINLSYYFSEVIGAYLRDEKET